MTSTPLVSVIMPVYNGEKYLKKAIASVAVQKLPLELITIDDCSQDNSAAIIASCRDDYPNMEFVHITNEKNMGVAKSRNAGVRVARAPYIAFLDCDDWWEPGKLSAQLSRMEKSCRVLSCTAREFVEDNGAPTGRIVPVSEVITYGQLLKFNSIFLSSALIKTEVAKEFPMQWDDCHEDYILWLNVLKKYKEADGINVPLLKYRRTVGAKTSSKIKSALMHYKSLRKAGIQPVSAAFHFVQYAVHGLKTHGGLR